MDAAAWDERYLESELVWSAGPNQFVESELSGLPPGRALDLAAGEGRNAIWLARQGWRVTAVDFSQAGLDKGRILGEGLDVTWVCADATTWTLEAAAPAYDVCLVAYLQLAADERAAAVRNAYGSVHTGGTLLWVCHDLTNHSEGVGGPSDPAVLMTSEDVLGDLAGHAFDVQHAGRVARLVPDGHREDAPATAWDCVVRVIRRD
jgi:SAM-dependent methyltransferase